MILDTLDSSFRYETLHPLFPSAFAFLRRPDLDALACGRIDLAGDDALYALIQTYETQPPAEGKPEAHRRYLDIQYVVSGSECVGYAPLAGLTPCQPFDEAQDYGLYAGPTSLVRLSQGMFAVLYPQLQEIDFRETATRFEIPMFFVQGAHEADGRAEPFDEWYPMVSAPTKDLVVLGTSGHRPMFEQPDEFVRYMNDTVLARTSR